MENPLKSIILAAERGGKQLAQHFGQELAITEKSMSADVATAADHDSEKAIIEFLTEKFPEYSILSEEIGAIDKGSEWKFIIDPLDGSHNFILGIPNFAVAIALTRNEEALYGVVHQPIIKKTNYVEKGKGFHFGDKLLKVNQESKLERSTISHIRNYVASEEKTNALYCALKLAGVKRFLSAWCPAWDFSLLASGKIEAIILDTTEKNNYDFTAGKLMVREAGGRITDFSGKDDMNDTNGQFIASNNTALHETLLTLIHDSDYA